MKTRTKLMRGTAIFASVLLVASPAQANAALPIVVVFGWFALVLALIPIILIECFVLARVGAHPGWSLLAMSVANLASTLAGFPIAVVLDALLNKFTPINKAPWEVRYWQKWYRDWMEPPGVGLILSAFCLLSWGIEAPIAVWILDDLPSQVVTLAVRDANLVTYGLLAAPLVAFFVRDMLLIMSMTRSIRKRRLSKASGVATKKASVSTESWHVRNDGLLPGISRLKAKEREIARLKPAHAANDLVDELDVGHEKAA
jgi:hypothetical protein